MSMTDFKTLQATRRKNILKLIAAAETAARRPNGFGLRRKLREALEPVTLQDCIAAAQDSLAATVFYKSANRLAVAQNSHQQNLSAEKILHLRLVRWLKPRPDTTHKRDPRPRADIHA